MPLSPNDLLRHIRAAWKTFDQYALFEHISSDDTDQQYAYDALAHLIEKGQTLSLRDWHKARRKAERQAQQPDTQSPAILAAQKALDEARLTGQPMAMAAAALHLEGVRQTEAEAQRQAKNSIAARVSWMPKPKPKHRAPVYTSDDLTIAQAQLDEQVALLPQCQTEQDVAAVKHEIEMRRYRVNVITQALAKRGERGNRA